MLQQVFYSFYTTRDVKMDTQGIYNVFLPAVANRNCQLIGCGVVTGLAHTFTVNNKKHTVLKLCLTINWFVCWLPID